MSDHKTWVWKGDALVSEKLRMVGVVCQIIPNGHDGLLDLSECDWPVLTAELPNGGSMLVTMLIAPTMSALESQWKESQSGHLAAQGARLGRLPHEHQEPAAHWFTASVSQEVDSFIEEISAPSGDETLRDLGGDRVMVDPQWILANTTNRLASADLAGDDLALADIVTVEEIQVMHQIGMFPMLVEQFARTAGALIRERAKAAGLPLPTASRFDPAALNMAGVPADSISVANRVSNAAVREDLDELGLSELLGDMDVETSANVLLTVFAFYAYFCQLVPPPVGS